MDFSGIVTVAAVLLIGQATAIDGDTLIVDGKRVRLRGVQAPELGTPEGEAAKRVMQGLVEGRTVTCEIRAWQKAKPPYSPRAIGDCSVSDRDLAAALIGTGVAKRH